jgi:UDP-N-acetylmuramate dehydrogenase
MNYTILDSGERGRIIEALRGCGEVRTDEPLSVHTSFKVGGLAGIFAEPKGEDGLVRALQILKHENIRPFILGNGTNVIFADDGFGGVVVSIEASLSEISIDGEELTAQAGALLSETASAAAAAGLSGFEALSGIPGSIGGAVYMNAGAYEHEIRDIAVSVRAFDTLSGAVRVFEPDELEFSYRSSRFQSGDEVILSAAFRLSARSEKDIRVDMSDYAKRRRDKQPINLPSAGSFFKRPEGAYAGALIEEAGLKGVSIGGASVSEKHAGFLVNTGGATTSDILELMKLVQDTVSERSGIILEPEPKIIT